MLKITVVDTPRRRRLIVEGELSAPWALELATAFETSRKDLQGRELVVDLRSLTAITPEGEQVLVVLMREKVKFLSGVYVREVLRQLGRKSHGNLPQDENAAD